jgi:hypothetical protein
VVGGGEVNGQQYDKKQCYQEALRLDPKYSMAWNNLGVNGGGEVNGQQYDKKQCYQEALRLDPTHTHTMTDKMEMAMRTYVQYVLPDMWNELVMLRKQNREWMLQQHTYRTRHDTLLDAVYRREAPRALADRFFLGSLVNRYLHTDGIWFLERFHARLMQRSNGFHLFAWRRIIGYVKHCGITRYPQGWQSSDTTVYPYLSMPQLYMLHQ